MKRPSFKEYLYEYKYFNSFSNVVSKEDDDEDEDKEDEETTNSFRKGKDLKRKERHCDDLEKNDDEEDYDPCKFRQWMQISNAGND